MTDTPKPPEALPLPLGHEYVNCADDCGQHCQYTVTTAIPHACGEPPEAHKPAQPLIEHEFVGCQNAPHVCRADACHYVTHPDRFACMQPRAAHRAEPPVKRHSPVTPMMADLEARAEPPTAEPKRCDWTIMPNDLQYCCTLPEGHGRDHVSGPVSWTDPPNGAESVVVEHAAEPSREAAPVGGPATSNSMPLVCVECGTGTFVIRCTKRDGLIGADGYPAWRCHKAAEHMGACSCRNDCGERDPNPERGYTCGKSPEHDGPHAWEGFVENTEPVEIFTKTQLEARDSAIRREQAQRIEELEQQKINIHKEWNAEVLALNKRIQAAKAEGAQAERERLRPLLERARANHHTTTTPGWGGRASHDCSCGEKAPCPQVQELEGILSPAEPKEK